MIDELLLPQDEGLREVLSDKIEASITFSGKLEKKQDVIELLGGRSKDAADALGITEGAFSRWRDPLPQKHIDRALGAALRRGRLGLVRGVVHVEFGIPLNLGERFGGR